MSFHPASIASAHQAWGHSTSLAPVALWADMYLKRMRREWPEDRLAVVLDIDDTVLTGSPQVPLENILELYHLARTQNYHIFFVTARLDINDNYQQTVDQLHANGFHSYTHLYLMPPQYLYEPNFSLFKYKIRKGLYDAGYSIVLNMGDTWHDLMLLPPYQTDPQAHQRIQYLHTLPNQQYHIFQPPDVAWMAVKMPRRPTPAAQV